MRIIIDNNNNNSDHDKNQKFSYGLCSMREKKILLRTITAIYTTLAVNYQYLLDFPNSSMLLQDSQNVSIFIKL